MVICYNCFVSSAMLAICYLTSFSNLIDELLACILSPLEFGVVIIYLSLQLGLQYSQLLVVTAPQLLIMMSALLLLTKLQCVHTCWSGQSIFHPYSVRAGSELTALSNLVCCYPTYLLEIIDSFCELWRNGGCMWFVLSLGKLGDALFWELCCNA